MQISGSSSTGLTFPYGNRTVSGREVKSDCPFRWTTSCPVHLSLFSAFMFPAWTLSASGFQRWLHVRIPGDLIKNILYMNEIIQDLSFSM